ncbi:MAG: hypothetical protein RMK84_10690 [Oscillochloridaceae bacterium]|nr:YaaA family protein [Chloroflexaceae bacterium]MDW8390580.1 hypothetical protein [Oscillochloridaceae bacterium]
MAQPDAFLLLACSQRKRADPDPLPALDRYDGPQFRLVRNYLRAHPAAWSSLEIAILSARFGLLSASERISAYEQRMTPARALQLRPEVMAALRQYVQRASYRRCCVAIGRDYAPAVEGLETILPDNCTITRLQGSPGERLASLFDWLYGNQARPGRRRPLPSGCAHLCGIEICLEPEAVLACGLNALRAQQTPPPQPKAWYVELDGHRVGPKWLVSQLAGLPVSAFSTTDALRVLAALGVEVQRL